jgi:TRAP transporter 4TM/12TM fusion protein
MTTAPNKGIDWSITETSAPSPIERYWSSRGLSFRSILALTLGVVGIIIPAFVVYRGYFGNMDPRIERSLIVALLLVYVFLAYPSGKRKWSDAYRWPFVIDAFLIFLVVATEIYTIWSWSASVGMGLQSTSNLRIDILGTSVRVDHIVGIIVVALVLEGTRRSFGWALVILSLVFIGYSLFASYFPGPLRGARATWTYLTEMLYVNDEGVYGIGAATLLSMIFSYLLFGSLLAGTKTGAFFSAIANALVGRYSGGAAKAAIVGSAAMGMVSGSATANVVTVGSVTIPLMKRIGYQPVFAAAVESCASSAGYFTPPVMGAAAFLIASFTNTSYLQVCVYAALPAALFFLGLFIQVHLRAQNLGLKGLNPELLPSARRVMLEGGHLILPVFIIIAGLVMGKSATIVAIWGILAVIVLSFIRKETRQTPFGMLALFDKSTIMAASVSMGVIAVGIIQGTLMVSGLGMKLSGIVEMLTAGNLIVGMLLAAVVTMILGMGVSPLLVYYIAYIFIIPVLINAGAPVMPAHIFALIYGAIANITPPVCMASFAAASIARAPPMKVGLEATKLGFAAFLVPFLLVLRPALLLLQGTTVIDAVIAIIASIAGISAMAAAFEGRLVRRARIWERVVLFAGGCCLMAPDIEIGAAGLAIVLFVAAWQRFRKPKAPAEKVSP